MKKKKLCSLFMATAMLASVTAFSSCEALNSMLRLGEDLFDNAMGAMDGTLGGIYDAVEDVIIGEDYVGNNEGSGGGSGGGASTLRVQSIAVDTTNAKTEYAFAEEFTTEGLKIVATMSDGSTKDVDPSACRIVKPDTTKAGTRTVTVVYEGQSARYEIKVNAKIIPPISATSLVDITAENDSVPYRVEAEAIDMVTPGVQKAEGVESFVVDAPIDADITSGDQYLTGYNVQWNYFGFTFTAAQEYESVTLVLRVANSTAADLDAGVMKMFLNFSQTEEGVVSGELPLDGYIIEANGAGKWSDIVIRNITIPQGTNTLTFEVQDDKAFDLDYIDFYVGMRYINSLVEITDTTTIVKELENFDTEKAFTREDVANAHGLKDGQLFVEAVTKESPGKTTSGGTSVGAIGKGSQMSTTLRLAQDATVRIKFKASAVGKGAYYVADHWNFSIDGVKLAFVERTNIEGGNSAAGEWWDWMYTNVGEINLPAGDHYFLVEVFGTDCNVDAVEFEVISLGSYDESGKGLDEMHACESVCPACGKCYDQECDKPACEEKCGGHENLDPNFDITVSAVTSYVFEAEDLDISGLTPSAGQTSVKIESPSGSGPATSGGKSLGCAGGGSASFTIKLMDKATVQIYGALAYANGGEAGSFMSAKLNDTDLTVSGTLPKGTGSQPYWNWAECPFGTAMDLEAGEYTLTITFLQNPNVDYFKIVAYSYGEFTEVVEPECEAICEECGKCTDADCTQKGHEEKCAGHEDEPRVDATLATEGTTKVEAENFDNSGVVTRQDFIDIGKLQAGQYGTESGNGETCIMGFTTGTVFTINVMAPQAMKVDVAIVGATDAANYDVSTNLAVTFNGAAVTAPSGLLTGSGATPYWDWKSASLGQFDFVEGLNVITITVTGHPNLEKLTFTVVDDGEEPVDPPVEPECEAICEECGKCTDADCTQEGHEEKCAGHEVVVTPDITITDAANSYKVEAEELDLSTLVPQAGFQVPVVESFNGGKGLGGIGAGGYQTFVVATEKDVKVALSIAFAKYEGGSILAYIPGVSVNDQALTLTDGEIAPGTTENQWWNVSNVQVATLELKAGTVYTFKVSVNSGNLDGYVLDVIDESGEEPVVPPVVEPECEAICEECGKCTDADCTQEGHEEKCAGHEDEPRVDATLAIEGTTKVEAENFDNSGVVTRQDFIDIGKLQAGQYGTESGNGETCIMGFTTGTVFTINVMAPQALKADVAIVGATDKDFDVSVNLAITFNGVAVTVPSGSLTGSGSTPYWDWKSASLGQFDFVEGLNVITITVTGQPNLDKLTITIVDESEDPVDPPVVPDCDIYITDEATSYKAEAEELDMGTLVPQTGFAAPVVESFTGGKGLGGIGAGGYQTFTVVSAKDVNVALSISFARAEGGSILSYIPGGYVNNQAIVFADGTIPAGTDTNRYWNVASVKVAVVALKANIAYEFKILVNGGNLDGYVLEVVEETGVEVPDEPLAYSDITIAASGVTKYELENINCEQCDIVTRGDFIGAVGAGNCGKGSGRIYGYDNGSIFRVYVKVESACTLKISLAGFGGAALDSYTYKFGDTELVPEAGAVIGSGGVVAEGVIGTVEVAEAGVYCFEFGSGVNTDLDYIAFEVVEA